MTAPDRSHRPSLPAAQRGAPALGRALRLIALIALGLPLAGCAVAIGPLPTPGPGTPGATPQVRFEVTPVDTPTPAPPSPTPAPPGQAIKYTIKQGDNLSSIADQFGVTVDDIVKTNNIEDPNQIYAGQVITITPRRSTPATAAPGVTLSPTAAHTP